MSTTEFVVKWITTDVFMAMAEHFESMKCLYCDIDIPKKADKLYTHLIECETRKRIMIANGILERRTDENVSHVK